MRASERACPFCSSALPEAAPERPAPRGALTRAAILFAGATAITGCSSGEPVAMYGPAPVDASSDAADATDGNATDGNAMPDVVAMYGPAPVDAGDG